MNENNRITDARQPPERKIRGLSAFWERFAPTGREARRPTSGEQTGGLPSRSSGVPTDTTVPTPVMSATGYGNHGANTTKNSMIGWPPEGGSAEDDIDLQSSNLRKRSRDLYAGGGLGRAAVAKMVTNVVGWGLTPKPKIDGDVLGMTEEACEEWQRSTLREFRLWADSRQCDANRQLDFWGLQELAFRSQLMSGDAFVLFGEKQNTLTPYRTVLRLLESDRVATPDTDGTSESKKLDNGNRVIDGIEIDQEGAVVRYHIVSRHPLAQEDDSQTEWTTIDAFGSDTGMPNVLHLLEVERPEQRRGVPFVAGMIEQIKQLDRYVTSEQAANLVSSMLTVFMTSDRDDGQFGMPDAVDEDERVTDDRLKIELRPGAMYDLPPGRKVQMFDPRRNSTAFSDFVKIMVTIIGASAEIPQEVLLSSYNSNYTASRAAMLDFWRVVRRYRTRFSSSFCRPVYEQWLAEAVALGRVEAPGFFDDPAVRAAWCGCQWMGASQGHVDPVKEAKAAQARIDMNISTQEQEAAEYNGNDWSAVMRQREKEMKMTNAMQTEAPDGDAETTGGNRDSPTEKKAGKQTGTGGKGN